MKLEDIDKLVEILAEEAFNSNASAQQYFRDLLRESSIPEGFMYEAVALLEDNPSTAARKLILWAKDKETNPENPDFTILGNLLFPLLPKLGTENLKIVIQLILRYKLLINKVLTKSLQIKVHFNEDLLLEYIDNFLVGLSNIAIENVDAIKTTVKLLLEVLNSLENLEVCTQAFLRTFQNPSLTERDLRQEIDLVKDPSITKAFRLFILMNWLLTDYPIDGMPIRRMADFAASLKPLVNASAKKALTEWLKTIRIEFGYQPSKALTQGTQRSQSLDAFLMIVIRRALSRGNRFHLHAFLFAEGQVEEWLELDNSQEEGPYTLKTISTRVSSYVHRAEQVLSGFSKKYKIAIEVFLPFQYWCEQVDNWPISLISKSITLGKEYRLALRSYERIADVIGTKDIEGSSLLLRHLRERWDEVYRFLDTDPEHALVTSRFISFCQEHICSHSALDDCLAEDNGHVIGLKIMPHLPIHKASKKYREELFEIALIYGLPIILWTRCEDGVGIELSDSIDSLLAKECLMDFRVLLDRMKDERKKAHRSKIGLGKHLVILFDDPNRLPTQPLPLAG